MSVPVSWAYGNAVRVRNRWFDRGLSVHTLDRPVISVGNLVLGGAGKSPMVAHLAAMLLDEGHHPVIALRGYGARKGERSDEHAEYAARLPGCLLSRAPIAMPPSPSSSRAIARSTVCSSTTDFSTDVSPATWISC